MSRRVYPQPVARGMVFLDLMPDGSMNVSGVLAPDTSTTGGWEQLVKFKLAPGSGTGPRLEAAHSTAAVVADRIAGMAFVPEPQRPARKNCEHVHPDGRECRNWPSKRKGCGGIHCWAHRKK